MDFVSVNKRDGIATLTLSRGKVNALNREVVGELRQAVSSVSNDDSVRALILTGSGAFFSFGFDVPELLDYSREQFTTYIEQFTALYADLFVCPKPVVAALNGHAVAGGCMLAVACDHRVMVSGRSKIGLNEVTFGASVFAGIVDILVHLLGGRQTDRLLLKGELIRGHEAIKFGLVDEVCSPEDLESTALEATKVYAGTDANAQAMIKRLVHQRIVDGFRAREATVIAEFVEQWYTPETHEQLKEIKIR